MERVERMQWRVLVERNWHPETARIAHAPIPRHLTGQERIDFHKARVAAQNQLAALFPPDPLEET